MSHHLSVIQQNSAEHANKRKCTFMEAFQTWIQFLNLISFPTAAAAANKWLGAKREQSAVSSKRTER